MLPPATLECRVYMAAVSAGHPVTRKGARCKALTKSGKLERRGCTRPRWLAAWHHVPANDGRHDNRRLA